MIEPLVGLLPVKTKNLSLDYKATRFVTGAKYDTVARHHVWFGSFTPEEQQALLTPEVLRETDGDIYREARRMLLNASRRTWSSRCRAWTRGSISRKTS